MSVKARNSFDPTLATGNRVEKNVSHGHVVTLPRIRAGEASKGYLGRLAATNSCISIATLEQKGNPFRREERPRTRIGSSLKTLPPPLVPSKTDDQGTYRIEPMVRRMETADAILK